jgi:thiol-disulfide isomerase/thioredoxin
MSLNRCGPCRFIAPTFAKLAEENPDANFIKVDVDDAEEIAAACQIQSMPTFQFYKSGKMIHSFSGASPPMLTAKVAELK